MGQERTYPVFFNFLIFTFKKIIKYSKNLEGKLKKTFLTLMMDTFLGLIFSTRPIDTPTRHLQGGR